MSTRLYYTLKAFLQFHPKWKAERKHRKARI